MSLSNRKPSRPIGERPQSDGADPQLTDDGVSFKMNYQGRLHEIQVPRTALQDLCDSQDPHLNLISAYQRHLARIQGVAGRILAARAGTSPVILKSDFFR